MRIQKELCAKYKAGFQPSPSELKIGVSRSALDGERPIHGLRHSPESGTTGWFICAGDYSDAADFFAPIHVSHIVDNQPEIIRYLGLAPGWRFLFDINYEDVWFDPSLLNI